MTLRAVPGEIYSTHEHQHFHNHTRGLQHTAIWRNAREFQQVNSLLWERFFFNLQRTFPSAPNAQVCTEFHEPSLKACNFSVTVCLTTIITKLYYSNASYYYYKFSTFCKLPIFITKFKGSSWVVICLEIFRLCVKNDPKHLITEFCSHHRQYVMTLFFSPYRKLLLLLLLNCKNRKFTQILEHKHRQLSCYCPQLSSRNQMNDTVTSWCTRSVSRLLCWFTSRLEHEFPSSHDTFLRS